MALRRIRQVFDPSLRSDLLSASALGFIGDVVCQILIEKRPAPKEIEDLKWGHEEGKFDVRRLWALTLFSSESRLGFRGLHWWLSSFPLSVLFACCICNVKVHAAGPETAAASRGYHGTLLCLCLC
ncbi:unnamed protein product, partial [Cladocopium goreaui]